MAMPDSQDSNVVEKVWDSLAGGIQQEVEETQREIKEINLMLQQSQGEVDKLSQRNSTVTVNLQQVQSQLETLPRTEIQSAYDAALDAQQRLIVMRSQLEKLQYEKEQLERRLGLLNTIQKNLQGGSKSNGTPGGGNFASAEMMIQAQESERQRLSRQMHDGPAQTLSNFILQTEIAMKLFDVDQDKARNELSNLKAAASTAFQQVRDFIFDLRPMMLDDLGLPPTVKRYSDAFREKTGIELGVTVSGNERRLESYLEVMVFRSMQELLNNAAKYSQATQIKIQLDISADSVRLIVEDNGKGFTEESLEKESGLGIKLIRERVEMLGGEFKVDSALGEGARISFDIPAANLDFMAQ